MKSYSETRKDSWLWKAKAPTVDVLARPEKLKKFAQISTKRRRKTFLFTRKFTRRVSTKDCWTLNDFAYIPRQQILTMVKTESETYRLKISGKTRPWSSRNSIVFRSFVPVLRQIRKGSVPTFFSPPNGKGVQEKRGIDSQRRVRATIYAESCWAVDVKGAVHHKRFKKGLKRWLVLEVLPCMNHEEVRCLRQHMQTQNVHALRRRRRKQGNVRERIKGHFLSPSVGLVSLT
jgi:hypothetical protein